MPTSGQPEPSGITALGIPLDDKSAALAMPDIREAFRRFAYEAFRGAEPPASYLDRLASIYDARRKFGVKHTAALRETLSVVLASPMFLYLAEPTADEKHRPLTEQELAMRLSYFLSGAPPDATLRDLARRGELSTPDVLAAQTNRLLDDPRADGFVRPFIYQWLGMDRLDFFEVNRPMYPRFDDSTKLAARNEVYETFAYLLRENASVRDLLKADYVVINSVMANYYGIEGVKGDAFQRVALPKDSPRGGLLGMAAIHVMGGNGERTSPVERGAWVLRKLLNDPPPPAPANVPMIARLADKVLTTRERMLAHQEEPQCASCHRQIDPIGFGLENFDAVRHWRTDGQLPSDRCQRQARPQGKEDMDDRSCRRSFTKALPSTDYFELRDIICSKSDAFARGFSTVLIEYALGRPSGFSDQSLIDNMLRQAGNKDFAIREFIHALVSSIEFHTK